MSEVPRATGLRLVRRICGHGQLDAWCAVQEASDAPRMVLVPHEDVGLEDLREVIERVAMAHSRIRASQVAQLAEHSSEGAFPFVSFACDPVSDLGTAVEQISTTADRPGHEVGGAFVDFLLDAFEAAHEAPGSEPLCLGALSAGNLILDRSGSLHLFGFGSNYPCHHMGGTAPIRVVAPEVALGAPPTEASDAYVIHATVMMLSSLVDLPDAFHQFARTLDAPGARHDAGVAQAVDAFNGIVLSSDPKRRPQTVRELRECYDRMRRDAGVAHLKGDNNALRALLRRVVRELDRPAHAVSVRQNGRLVVLHDGTEIDLSRRRSLRLILLALLEQHERGAGNALTVEQLQEAGWPREPMLIDAAKNRVYVAVTTLRKLGLGALLLRRDDGYLLEPSATFARTEA